MIKELLGKNKEREEETYVYTQEGDRKEIMEISEEYVVKWKQTIYQKTDRIDFSFWHGKNGIMKDMIDKEKKHNSGIMKFPIINEDELTEVIRNMKNGKASGTDGISAELMKYMIKDVDIRKYMLKCFNNVLKEEIHEDWLISKITMIPKVKQSRILDHRPIAVTVNSSKIICTILRKK